MGENKTLRNGHLGVLSLSGTGGYVYDTILDHSNVATGHVDTHKSSQLLRSNHRGQLASGLDIATVTVDMRFSDGKQGKENSMRRSTRVQEFHQTRTL